MERHQLGSFFSAMLGERIRQDDEMGAQDGLERFFPAYWQELLEFHTKMLLSEEEASEEEAGEDYEQLLVKIASLASAAWEAHRRQKAREGSPS